MRQDKAKKTAHRLWFLLFAVVTMTYARGWEGDYGYETGAMVPGAMVAMAVCLSSGRRDWWERCLVWAMFAAIGWGFAGSMSYGLVIGYTQHATFWGVAYGFACLFIIGLFYGACGGAFLGMAIVESRRRLNSFVGPIVAIFIVWAALHATGVTAWSKQWPPPYQVDWLAAVSALATAGIYCLVRPRSHGAKLFVLICLGWFAGFGILTLACGLRMSPPRHDQWAGITGILIVMWGYLTVRRLRAATLVMGYSGIGGGFGFSIGAIILNFANSFGWPVNSWRFMEQFFGTLMGLGVGIAVFRLAALNLAPADEDAPAAPTNTLAACILFPGLLGWSLYFNFHDFVLSKTMETGAERITTMPDVVYGISVWVWLAVVLFLGITAFVWALYRHRRNPLPFIPSHPLGKGQLIYLVMLCGTLALAFALKAPSLRDSGQFHSQFSFAVLAIFCAVMLVSIRDRTRELTEVRGPSDGCWRMGWPYWLLWLAVPLVLFLLTRIALEAHPEPIPGSRNRFEYTEDG